jgi:N-acetylneuraminate synthase
MMKGTFNFENLFIYDLANNHQGDYSHACNIVREVAAVSEHMGVRGALKFQFRQLNTFIHPDFQARSDNKYVKRFTETKLLIEDFLKLAGEVRNSGMLTMCTPFDEESVDIICDMDLDIIKVASCSADDRPLLEKISRVKKPVVVSTAGLRTEEIDWLVNFLESEHVHFALMHCVAIYPTPYDKLQLNQVRYLKERYPHISVGWSTHEDPDNTSAIQVAYAMGARLFERHVGLNTDKYKLNNYSSTPLQLEKWITAFRISQEMVGASERPPAQLDERTTLYELKRGTYARHAISRGAIVERQDVFFAMPMQYGQMTSGHFRSGTTANRDYSAFEPLDETLAGQDVSDEQLVYQIMLQIRGMLNKARIHINSEASIEISHHYGLRRFREYGAVIITCINRDYAKKLVIQLPRQKHPYHFHKQKEETFQLLAGDLEIIKDGHRFAMELGDTHLVEPGQWHKFHTLDGCVFEEVSTTHFNNDSFYEDPIIARLDREQRKTKVDNWLAYFRVKHAL